MPFRLTFLTGLSLLFMAAGLYLAFADRDGNVGARYFFITLGIVGWFIGNRLVELDERVADLEKALAASRDGGTASEGPTEVAPAAPTGADARSDVC